MKGVVVEVLGLTYQLKIVFNRPRQLNWKNRMLGQHGPQHVTTAWG